MNTNLKNFALVLGSVLTGSLGFAGNLYNNQGQVQAPNGSQQSMDYFRLRQSWLDLAASRRIAEENRLHGLTQKPCGK